MEALIIHLISMMIGGVIGNRTDELLVKLFNQTTSITWKELLFQSFQKAAENHEEYSLNEDDLWELLHSKLNINIDNYYDLQQHQQLTILVDAMVERRVLNIPDDINGKSLYRNLIQTIVDDARDVLRNVIQNDEQAFRKATLDLLEGNVKEAYEAQQAILAFTHQRSALSTSPRVFVSYSRRDGENFAKNLRNRLENVGISTWRDRDRMEGGKSWWKQIQQALETVEFMVLVATPEALASPIVKKEWKYARQQGVCVYPVKVPDLEPDFDSLPIWLKSIHFYDTHAEWQTFVNYLQNPCQIDRVPFMVRDLPTSFVERPQEFNQVINQILDKDMNNPLAITTSLNGAGGFGKTTLAQAICHHPDVLTAFVDGILWVDLGENPNVVAQLSNVYKALTGETITFVDELAGAKQLGDVLQDKHCLLVIDDVWEYSHLEPFLEGGKSCTRLITTRFMEFAIKAESQLVEVDEMQPNESIDLLLYGIDYPEDLTPFQVLTERLGEWALLLEIANGILKKRLTMGNTLGSALERINRMLSKYGIVKIQQNNDDQRKQGALGVLEVSLDLLDNDEKQRLYELSIFLDDNDIYLSSIQALWDMDEFDTDELLEKFLTYSLIRYEPETGVIRLHDVIREVLGVKLAEIQEPSTIHACLIDNYGDLHNLPDDYAWKHIAYHLQQANKLEQLQQLLVDYRWNPTNLGHGWQTSTYF